MELQIQSVHMHASDDLVDHVERRLGSAMSRVVHRITDIAVRLIDPGPNGTVSLTCGVVVRLRGGTTVVIHEMDACPYRAVSRAAGRAKQLVNERIKRARTRVRRRPRRVADPG